MGKMKPGNAEPHRKGSRQEQNQNEVRPVNPEATLRQQGSVVNGCLIVRFTLFRAFNNLQY